MVISSASRTTVRALFDKLDFVVVEKVAREPTDVHFEAFDWGGRSENTALTDARNHIERQMKKFNNLIGSEGGFKVVDVHADKTFLNMREEKIGNISGTCDLVIVPFDADPFSFKKGLNVIFEIKTPENVQNGGFQQFDAQIFLELVCARYYSNQPMIAVVTDLSSGGMIFEIEYAEESRTFSVVRSTASLNQMGAMVADVLPANPTVRFRPSEGSENPRVNTSLQFKKRNCSHDHGIALEHFDEMIEDTEPESRERAHLVRQLFMSMDVPRMPTMLQYSMYA